MKGERRLSRYRNVLTCTGTAPGLVFFRSSASPDAGHRQMSRRNWLRYPVIP